MILPPHLILSFIFPIGLAVFAYGYNQSTPVPTRPKVFVIGLSKTGTTSLGDALEGHLNYTRYGWHDIWSRYIVHQAILPSPNLEPVVLLSKQYEVLEDLPWCLPHVYTNMSKLYPDSVFILSLRRNEKIWLESMRRHAKQKLWEGHRQIYGAYQVDGNDAVFLEAYRNHTAAVRKFFASREMKGRGLEIVIDDLKDTDDARWQRLVTFLNIELKEGVERLGSFPRSNGNQAWKNRDPFGVHWFAYRLAFAAEKSLVSLVDSLGYMMAMMA